jgi:hypothetical protein
MELYLILQITSNFISIKGLKPAQMAFKRAFLHLL